MLVALMLDACSDDFLNENPKSFLSPENTFVDAKGLKAVVDAGLQGIMFEINRDGGQAMFDNITSDVMVAGTTDKNYMWQDCNKNATPQNAKNKEGVRNMQWYYETYKNIKNANTVIDNINVPKWESDKERNHLLGTAYFIRAYFYYMQTMHFGNSAFVLTVISSARNDFQTFTMESIWKQMITDLEWAEKWVKPANELPKGQVGNSAVRMLLTKYYLLTNQFKKAEDECDVIINSGVHHLVTDADVNPGSTIDIGMGSYDLNGDGIKEVFGGRSVTVSADAVNTLHSDYGGGRLLNSEAILVFVNANNLDGTQRRAKSMRSYGPNFGNGSGAGRVKTPDGNNGINDKSRKGEQMAKWGRGQGQNRPTNYSQYYIWNKNPNDPSQGVDTVDYRHKRGNWLYMNDVVYDNASAGDWYGKPLRLYNDKGDLLCQDTIRNWFGYPLYKFWVLDLHDTRRQDGGEASLYLYRLAEVYLLRAEARFWQGDYQGAADDINVIRNRAHAIYQYTAYDVQRDGIGAILDERARELYGEEFRGSELTRIALMFATNGKTAYNGKTYNIDDISKDNFWYDRVMEKNDFFREHTPTIIGEVFTLSPYHIFWPINETFINANVGAVLNQTPGYLGDERNIPPLVHKVQPAGQPNVDPMEALGM